MDREAAAGGGKLVDGVMEMTAVGAAVRRLHLMTLQQLCSMRTAAASLKNLQAGLKIPYAE